MLIRLRVCELQPESQWGVVSCAGRRQLQRELDILQRKIASVRREQAPGGAPGGAAAAFEDSLAAAGGAWPPGEGAPAAAAALTRSVRGAIQRDKAIARLGLAVLEEFPRDVLVDLVQVCNSQIKSPAGNDVPPSLPPSLPCWISQAATQHLSNVFISQQ
jgi:hypothetical protein